MQCFTRLMCQMISESHLAIPVGCRWGPSMLVELMLGRSGEALHLNATGVAVTCFHKNIPHEEHIDGIKSYVHVNMLFPAILVRKVPMNGAVLTVEASMQSGNPFASDRSQRQATVLITCTTLAGNIVYSGNFKDCPLKQLHFRNKVHKALIESGKCSCNTRLQYVVGTQPLRGNALVWKGSTKMPHPKVVGKEVKTKQLKMHSFAKQ